MDVTIEKDKGIWLDKKVEKYIQESQKDKTEYGIKTPNSDVFKKAESAKKNEKC